jgi:hypothetical protein
LLFLNPPLGSCFSHVLIQVFSTPSENIEQLQSRDCHPRSPCGCRSSFLTST